MVWNHIFPLECMRISFHGAWFLKIYSKNIKCFCLACFICSCNFFYSSVLFEPCSCSLEYTEQLSATEPSGKKMMRNLSNSWGNKKEKAYHFFPSSFKSFHLMRHNLYNHWRVLWHNHVKLWKYMGWEYYKVTTADC